MKDVSAAYENIIVYPMSGIVSRSIRPNKQTNENEEKTTAIRKIFVLFYLSLNVIYQKKKKKFDGFFDSNSGMSGNIIVSDFTYCLIFELVIRTCIQYYIIIIYSGFEVKIQTLNESKPLYFTN